MPHSIRPFTKDLLPKLNEFNALFTKEVRRSFTPTFDVNETHPTHTHSYAVVNDDEDIVGVYKVKKQLFSIHGNQELIGMYQLPISKGIHDRRYAMVGFQMLKDCLKRSPKLFCLGMGSLESATAKMVKALKWQIEFIPFFALIVSPKNVFKEISMFKKKFGKLWPLVYGLRLPHLAIFLFNFFKSKRVPPRLTFERVEVFGVEADRVWEQARGHYSFIGCRDAETLNLLYPPSITGYHKILVKQADEVIGWALVFTTQMKDDPYFGQLNVGFIADFLATNGLEQLVTLAATEYLKGLKADIITVNQSHETWQVALKSLGYIKGPSTYIWASSKPLSETLGNLKLTDLFINRGDNDGPLGLLLRGQGAEA